MQETENNSLEKKSYDSITFDIDQCENGFLLRIWDAPWNSEVSDTQDYLYVFRSKEELFKELKTMIKASVFNPDVNFKE